MRSCSPICSASTSTPDVTALRIGTRRSRLALAQSEEVARLLAANGVETELVPMSTSGDEGAPPTSNLAGLKGLFVDAILDALENEAIDVAVHSAKDLPADEDDGFTIAAVPARENPLDVLITRGPDLPHAARIGTSSLRRRAQILRAYPGVEVVELRGNVDTRLRKVEEGEIDAAILAVAGLRRLGVVPGHSLPLSIEEMVPAPGQGALALQTREDDDATIAALAPLDDRASHLAVDAERSVMWRLGGGCALPLGALADLSDGVVHLIAVVATPDGSTLLRAEATATAPEDAAAAVTKDLMADGAEGILAAVRDAG
jgi:hydroxymethylbilane synthase